MGERKTEKKEKMNNCLSERVQEDDIWPAKFYRVRISSIATESHVLAMVLAVATLPTVHFVFVVL